MQELSRGARMVPGARIVRGNGSVWILGAITGKLGKFGDIVANLKNKFLKTVIFGEFVVSFVLTARNFGALTFYIGRKSWNKTSLSGTEKLAKQ